MCGRIPGKKIVERHSITNMKNKNWQVGFLILLLVAAGFAGGCASGGGAYPTLRATEVNVDAPMTRYRNAVSEGRVTTGMQERVNQAYAAYKKGFDAALKAANDDRGAHTPDDVQALANQLLTVLGEVPML
jgi:hypothetical protein